MGWLVCAHRLLAAALPPSALSASLDTFYYPCSDSSCMSDPPTATPYLPVGGFDVPPVKVVAGRLPGVWREAACCERMGRWLRQEHHPLSRTLHHPSASPSPFYLSHILGKSKCFHSIVLSVSPSVFRALVP